MNRKIVVIPSLNPDDKLITLITALKSAAENRCEIDEIIVVNDGSNDTFSPHFSDAAALGCTVLTHKINCGKGQALKTAFSYILENNDENVSVVCADADGQHQPCDILACLNAVVPNTLVVGCRNFSDKSVPFRSKFGNKFTRLVFHVLCGVRVSDTQTGLRAMDLAVMKQFLAVSGSRFEYEMNMLIEAHDAEIDIAEIPITTIYNNGNDGSHFNPLLDSARIYSVFARFLLSSTASFIVDISLFTATIELLHTILTADKLWWIIPVATVVARAVSSLVNFYINKNRVFSRKKSTSPKIERRTFARYYLICIMIMTCSAALVNIGFLLIPVHASVIKLVVDTGLFIVSFRLQHGWVFNTNSH